jgi:uncharacterized protein (TIGR02453 family)
MFQGFGAGALRFFEELAENNTRDWWLANKPWYETDIRAPLEHLLQDLAGEFGEAKVFRPNRDTRFSADKSPYKTQAAASVGDGPGNVGLLYVQLSATGLLVAGGSYMPARDQLARLREAIADDRTGAQLDTIIADLRRANARVEAHDTLKTAPRGYPADHPRIELLRLKGIIAVVEHAPEPWLHTERARDEITTAWRSFAPLNTWLTKNVGPSTLPPDRR